MLQQHYRPPKCVKVIQLCHSDKQYNLTIYDDSKNTRVGFLEPRLLELSVIT